MSLTAFNRNTGPSKDSAAPVSHFKGNRFSLSKLSENYSLKIVAFACPRAHRQDASEIKSERKKIVMNSRRSKQVTTSHTHLHVYIHYTSNLAGTSRALALPMLHARALIRRYHRNFGYTSASTAS